jgi:hypothetical protein
MAVMKKNKDTIFVQLASYRDPELVPTIDNMLENAKYPDNLHICIAFQYSEEDEFTKELDKYRDDTRFTIIDIPFTAAKGACWARNLIQQEYKKEKYTLQLDSHHRFTKDWDISAVDMLVGLQERGYSKPLLTSYIPSYNPANDPDQRINKPWGMSFDRFTPEGVVFFLPYYIENNPLNPIPARWYSAHFVFTLGQHAIEVQHDPEYYFHGEEITLAVRSYTHGYDLFHPNKVLAWHEYTRVGRVKQWDDDKEWVERNNACHKKVRSLLGVDNENDIEELEYGLGTERTLQDYEVYAGIKFSNRSITEACKKNVNPPGTPEEQYYQEFKHAIDLFPSQFPEDDYSFCAVIFEDNKGQQIYREDLTDKQLNNYLKTHKATNNHFTIWRKYSGPKPNHIIIWPHSISKGWGEKRTINV